jgi:hypothetical protein
MKLNRFRQLLESTIGDVKPLITEEEFGDEVFADISRQNRKLFREFEAPEKITLKLTNKGYEKIKTELENWIPNGTSVNRDINIQNEISLERSFHFGKNIKRVGEIRLRMEGRKLPTFANYVRDDGTTGGSGFFYVYAEYFPEMEKNGEVVAIISLTKGHDRNGEKMKENLDKVPECKFSKIEVGEIDDRGWFEIIDINN